MVESKPGPVVVELECIGIVQAVVLAEHKEVSLALAFLEWSHRQRFLKRPLPASSPSFAPWQRLFQALLLALLLWVELHPSCLSFSVLQAPSSLPLLSTLLVWLSFA